MNRLPRVILALSAICALCCGLGRPCVAADTPEFPEEPVITESDRDHWAFLPLSDAAPPNVDDPRWRGNPIDRFVKATLDENGLTPLPAAGKAAMLRRLCFDLTGLPPTPEQVAQFLADNRPDAYQRVVERLLASPAYGERWAQHWLDLARFAETDGFEHDLVRPNAWRYRDWVIDALNCDMPFNEFAAQQIAGDQLYPQDPKAAVATGFLLSGPDMPDINLQDERRHFVLNEMTGTVGSVFLALQVGCAECHDHKWDPITQYDFYRLRAFFESADLFRDHPIPTNADLQRRRQAEAALAPEDVACRQREAELVEIATERFRARNPDVRPGRKDLLAELTDAERTEIADLTKRLETMPPLPELPLGRVMQPGPERTPYLYIRGDFRRPGPELDWRTPQVLDGERPTAFDPAAPPRVELARWLTEQNQRLTARVAVNRFWQWHFGRGLAANASDFGLLGDEPTHPDLLDWLARWLIDGDWSVKRLHYLIVTSETYQVAGGAYDASWSADTTAAAQAAWAASHESDPDGDLLWRRRRTRLEGEAIRDAMLAASDQLSTRRGGQSFRPPLPPEVTSTLLKNQWNVTKDQEEHYKRSVYLFVRRNLRYPLFDVFDRPDTNASCARRYESTTATQSLVLLNSQFSLEMAEAVARIVAAQSPGEGAEQVEQAYLRILGRTPSPHEAEAGKRFIERPDRESHESALAEFCLALFNTNEFVYPD